MPFDEIDQLKLVRPAPVKGNRKATQVTSDDAIRKRLKARQLIEELRSICPSRTARRKPSSHSTPLYLFIHRQFEAELEDSRSTIEWKEG
jgi:hypothetical protein